MNIKNKPYYGFLDNINPLFIREDTARRLAAVSVCKTVSHLRRAGQAAAVIYVK